MATGSGTSFNQPYNILQGGLMSQPYPSMVGGNTPLYEYGGGSVSINQAPNIRLVTGGRRRRTKKRESRKRNKSKRSKKSSKTCSVCQSKFGWV